jgi:predicted RNA methylase
MSALQKMRTHAEMFGMISALRDAIAWAVATKYNKESFDRRYGTDTAACSLEESQIPAQARSEAVQYEPANAHTLHHVFRALPFSVRDFHLVDIGCGKGRTLLVGAQYPFRGITGVELSPETAAIAKRNIARFKALKCTICDVIDVQIANATEFRVPDGHLLCTMYNPFFGQTFERCIEHLHCAALLDPARELWLAYINPWHCEEYLMATGYFERVANYEVLCRTWKWNLWRHR